MAVGRAQRHSGTEKQLQGTTKSILGNSGPVACRDRKAQVVTRGVRATATVVIKHSRSADTRTLI